jgi:hypothetical protein
MSPLRSAEILATSLAAAFVLAACPAAFADGHLSCFSCWHKCPPRYVHCLEGPPRIKFKCGCPKPICDPCSLDHYGYYQTCWRPWSFPPDWSHCPVPPAVEAFAAPTPTLPPVDIKPMPEANHKQ